MVTLNVEASTKAFPNHPKSPPSPQPEQVPNAVMQALIEKGNAMKNFGQCIIFMLNRERIPWLIS
jgi:SPIN90/Ldb17, leucine-rich domain